ncbi:hypothetical protein P154DRAFT_497986 [Amniculicola lignicola CBS 123094]|uniref:Rhodopsin domain-containing protein n=1 Tax=Amniculicola lignicola CBS 123094 TaxID=1392246 RepID=A0A6A5W9D1_9PLEO|nr:hypothetical protein P154DRAFT_497986 [Amniculicola lignicola CBS 123094]
MPGSVSALAVESWVLYVLGVSLIVSRLVFRRITLGSFGRFQYDDWLMIFVLVPFTGTIVCATQVSIYLHQPKDDGRDQRWGLKLRFILEDFQLSTSWLVKGCLLILYLRIFPSVTNRKERRYLNWVSVFCAISFLVVLALVPVWCYPVHEYWNSQSENLQCSTYRSHSIASMAFNVTTSLAVFVLPIPFIPTPRRILLAVLVALGTLVVATGIIGRYYILTQPTSPLYLHWYTAEAAATICFANLPFLSSLVTSTSFSRNRCLSGNVSLSQWPRSVKSSPPMRAQRLDSNATLVGTVSAEERPMWWDPTLASSMPPVLIPTLSLGDAPLELERCVGSRRPSTRDDRDVEMSCQGPVWPREN